MALVAVMSTDVVYVLSVPNNFDLSSHAYIANNYAHVVANIRQTNFAFGLRLPFSWSDPCNHAEMFAFEESGSRMLITAVQRCSRTRILHSLFSRKHAYDEKRILARFKEIEDMMLHYVHCTLSDVCVKFMLMHFR